MKVQTFIFLGITFLFNIAFSQYYDKQASVVSNTNGKVTLLQEGSFFTLNNQIVTVKLQDNKTIPSDIKVIRANILGYYDIEVPNNISYEDYMKYLKSLQLFSVIEYNAIGKYNEEIKSNDSSIDKQWYLSRINIFNAWKFSFGDENIKIGVLDSGLDWAHKDIGLGRDSYQNVYLNPNEDLWKDNNNPSTGDYIDNDRNGFIDDLKGWNFITQSNDVRTTNSHGTQVSGIISAKTNNAEGIAGIVGGNKKKGVQVIPVCVGIFAPESSILDDAIIYAVNSGVRIIQLSLSVLKTDAIEKAIDYAKQKNVLIICASGNDSSNNLSYPSSNEYVIAVGGIDRNNRRAPFSNYGNNLSVVAPGIDIFSTGLNNTYLSSDGTSFAAPQVSGVVALILSVNPDLTAKQAADIIEQTAQKVGGYNYQNDPNHPNGTWNYEMGYGLVDAYEAVKTAKQMLVPKPRLEAPDVMPWGFCKKAIFKVENFPLDEKNATIDWKFPRGSRMTKEIAKNEVEIDFGTNYRAEVHAVVNTQDYKNLDLMYVNTNNNYVRSDMLCMRLEKEKDNKYKMNFVLDTLFIKPLTPYQRQKIVNITTNDCRLYQENSNQEYLEITGSNPSVRATITLAPDTCPDEPITFYLNNITNGYSFIHTEESKKLGDKPDDKTDTCATPEEIEGEVFSNGWQGARRYYFDFYKHKHPYDYLDEETKYKTSAPTSRVSTGYFEIVPAKGYITAHQPMKIQATPNGAELFIDSPRYVGYQEWGKAWIRYVPEDCKASKWELWDFSKAGYATNGYFIDRDKGYSPGTYSMYPNPATNTVFFSVRQPQTESRRGVSLFSAQKNALQNEPYQIEVFNTAGVRVLHQEGKGTIAEFSVAHLPAGIYIVHFTQNGVTHKEKLIVE